MPHPNKNSQKNLDAASKAKRRPGHQKKIKVTQEVETLYEQLGQGSMTDGVTTVAALIKRATGNNPSEINRLFVMLPIFSQIKAILELSLEYLPEDKRAITESVLLQMEDLEIEQAYKETKIEGLETKSGAIV